MKKRLTVLVLLVLVVCVVAFAGCKGGNPLESDKEYIMYLNNPGELETLMGTGLKYPSYDMLKGGEFFDYNKYKDAVTIPAEAKENMVQLVFIPPLTKSALKDLYTKKTDGKLTAADVKAYRYSVTMTLKNKVVKDEKGIVVKTADGRPKMENVYGDDLFTNGVITLYIHGTDYSKVAGEESAKDVKCLSVEDFKTKQESAKKGDKKDLEKNNEGQYFVSEIKDGVYCHENKVASQVMRYIVVTDADGNQYSYTITAQIAVTNDFKKDIEGNKRSKEEAAKLSKDTYDGLLAKSRELLDGFVVELKG